MHSVPPLTPRLMRTAEMVRTGGLVADIGTDHAYLPVYLVGSGKNPKAAASDLREGPLGRARETVEKYGLSDRISLVLADGLQGVPFADDVVVAGMGGDLIASILERAAFIRDPRVRLVLQPMTKVPDLRRWLCRSGFRILRESAVREGRRLYVVLAAGFTSERYEPEELFAYSGLLPRGAGPEDRDYLRWQAALLRRKARGLEKSGTRKEEAARVQKLALALEALAGGERASE